MLRKNIKKISFIFVLGFLMGIGLMGYATSTQSAFGYYGPYQGYSYKNLAYLEDAGSSPNPIYAGAWAGSDNSGNIPTGYMGAQARMFKNDVLNESTSMMYNSSATTGFSVLTDNSYLSGTYYSKGITAAYNGNGYTNYYTFQSPSINH